MRIRKALVVAKFLSHHAYYLRHSRAERRGEEHHARALLNRHLTCMEFVNADDIARGLSAFRPESVAMKAGRVMLNRLDELAGSQIDFAFETTYPLVPLRDFCT